MRWFTIVLCGACVVARADLWINEFHYDDVGADTGEFVEVFVSDDVFGTGVTSSDVFIVLLDGATGSLDDPYEFVSLSLTAETTVSGGKMYDWRPSSIDNGAPDGIALLIDMDGDHILEVGDGDRIVEVLSYEGAYTVSADPAADGIDEFALLATFLEGSVATPISVSESDSTLAGTSLQRTGTGSTGSAFTWTGPVSESPGAINSGQTITAVPEPTSLVLLGLAGLCAARRRRRAA